MNPEGVRCPPRLTIRGAACSRFARGGALARTGSIRHHPRAQKPAAAARRAAGTIALKEAASTRTGIRYRSHEVHHRSFPCLPAVRTPPTRHAVRHRQRACPSLPELLLRPAGAPAATRKEVDLSLEEEGVSEDDRLQDTVRFLYSGQALCAPENHLGALLHASLAWRAICGQGCPSRGTPNDIAFIAAYLPYCDAMFIDNEFAQLLSEGRLAAAANDYPTKIFSTRSRDDFLEYLHELEADAEPAHLDIVTRTYGETWTQPYRSMLEHERSKPRS